MAAIKGSALIRTEAVQARACYFKTLWLAMNMDGGCCL